MPILSGTNIGKWFGAERIFDGVNVLVNRGDKIALVGPNGAGKSTLLKILSGINDSTEGFVSKARSLRVAYLAQEVTFEGGMTLMEAAQRAFDHLNEMEAELRELETQMGDTDHPDWEERMERYGELQSRFEHAGGYETEHMIERTLEGLSFREEHFNQRLDTFSGGQKTRAALAITLLQDPDLLMLDEPTNHLDLRALQWLEEFLRTWPGTLVVISHDRYFLDRVTTRTLEMAFGHLDDYPGNYSKFLQLKAERIALQQKEYDAQQDFIAKEEEFIRRFKAGQRSKEARGRETRLNRLKDGWVGVNPNSGRKLVEAPRQSQALKLNLNTQLRSGEIVLRISNNLKAGYHTPSGDKVLVRTPSLSIERGERIALMGPNGAGKTTLMRTITNELPALAGHVSPGVNVSVGYYAQIHEELIMENTILEEVHRLKPLEPTERIRTLLGRFLFTGDDVYKRVGDLSGGERSRVALAQLTLKSPNLLLLDEPTNHLDIAAREALEGVLREFPGSILFVSHDRYFVDALADKLWIVEHGTVAPFEGGYTAYQQHLDAEEQARKRAAQAPAKQNGAAREQTDDRETRKRQRNLQSLEDEIAKLESRKTAIGEAINTASQKENIAEVTKLGKEYSEIEARLLDTYDKWATVAAEA